MNINIQAVNFNATERLQEYINKKINKLYKVHDDMLNVDVYLKVVKPETALNKEVQIKIAVPNVEFFASKICDSFEEATDLSVDALDKQLKKHKEKNMGK